MTPVMTSLTIKTTTIIKFWDVIAIWDKRALINSLFYFKQCTWVWTMLQLKHYAIKFVYINRRLTVVLVQILTKLNKILLLIKNNRKYKDYVYRKMLVQEYLNK